MRSSAILLLCLAAFCAAPPPEPQPTDAWLLVDALPPRILVADDEDGEASRVLERLLDAVGPAVEGQDRARVLIRESGGGTVRLRYAVDDDRLTVQAVDAYGSRGGHPGELIAALAYHLEVAGVSYSADRYSGCRLPPELADAGNFGEALAAVFRERGLVQIDMEVGQHFNQTIFGTQTGEPRWHVDLTWAARANPDTIEFFHDAAEFDAKGEEDLLLEFLGRLTTRTVAFEQRTTLADGGYWTNVVED
ncbi:MAG: hypothetical protein ACYTDY_19345 [Planctomycetota bacterium]|jgi:hypothetical protein